MSPDKFRAGVRDAKEEKAVQFWFPAGGCSVVEGEGGGWGQSGLRDSQEEPGAVRDSLGRYAVSTNQ
jgi:hypothetical protein